VVVLPRAYTAQQHDRPLGDRGQCVAEGRGDGMVRAREAVHPEQSQYDGEQSK
jgi:hypothetical protein